MTIDYKSPISKVYQTYTEPVGFFSEIYDEKKNLRGRILGITHLQFKEIGLSLNSLMHSALKASNTIMLEIDPYEHAPKQVIKILHPYYGFEVGEIVTGEFEYPEGTLEIAKRLKLLLGNAIEIIRKGLNSLSRDSNEPMDNEIAREARHNACTKKLIELEDVTQHYAHFLHYRSVLEIDPEKILENGHFKTLWDMIEMWITGQAKGYDTSLETDRNLVMANGIEKSMVENPHNIPFAAIGCLHRFNSNGIDAILTQRKWTLQQVFPPIQPSVLNPMLKSILGADDRIADIIEDYLLPKLDFRDFDPIFSEIFYDRDLDYFENSSTSRKISRIIDDYLDIRTLFC